MKNQQKTVFKESKNMIEGAKQEDQLEKLAPKNDKERNHKEEQIGAMPVKHVEDGSKEKSD